MSTFKKPLNEEWADMPDDNALGQEVPGDDATSSNTDSTDAPPYSSPLKYSRAWELAKTSEVLDIVQGLLAYGSVSVVYGPSNLGKSFWVLDLAAAITTGRPFRDDLETDHGAVLYFSLEGKTAFQNRLDALRVRELIGEDTPMFISFDGIDLSMMPDPNDDSPIATYGEMIVETIKGIEKAEGRELKLVIIDTLSRAMGGGDENSGRDMMAVVSQIEHIKRETSAHICIVHHTGKDETRGARGHSSLRAAVDTEIELSKTLGQSITTVRVTKQRDMQVCPPMPFSLDVIELGRDRRGDPITSCVVHHEDEIMAEVPSKGRKPTHSIAALLKLLPMLTTTTWQKVAKSELGVSSATFYELLREVRNQNSAIEVKGEGWKLPKVNFRSDEPLPL